jgi:hypothetical protein
MMGAGVLKCQPFYNQIFVMFLHTRRRGRVFVFDEKEFYKNIDFNNLLFFPVDFRNYNVFALHTCGSG